MSRERSTWFVVLHVIGSLDVRPVVLAVAGAAAVPEPRGVSASASTARRAPRRCPDLSCVERHDDISSGELLTVPAPQS